MNKIGLKIRETSKSCVSGSDSAQERESKIVLDGVLNFSFGKNGPGLTDELFKIGELIKTLSKDNHVYIDEAFVDTCDDVYDLKFRIIPHEFNKWMVKENAFGGGKEE